MRATIHMKTVERVRDLLVEVQGPYPDLARLAVEANALCALPPFARGVNFAKPEVDRANRRVADKAAARSTSWREVKRIVFARADGYCENPDCPCPRIRQPLEADHYLGGRGRRVALQGHETVWALCRFCHANKTNNFPGRDAWEKRFRQHCNKYRYPVPVKGYGLGYTGRRP